MRTSSYLKFIEVLSIGAVLALVLCIQCVRTYLYTDAVLYSIASGASGMASAGIDGMQSPEDRVCSFEIP
jgi:hypothetical protein